MYSVSLLEFRGDKVVHERIYIMHGWDVISTVVSIWAGFAS
jgi:hypothetical protein